MVGMEPSTVMKQGQIAFFFLREIFLCYICIYEQYIHTQYIHVDAHIFSPILLCFLILLLPYAQTIGGMWFKKEVYSMLHWNMTYIFGTVKNLFQSIPLTVGPSSHALGCSIGALWFKPFSSLSYSHYFALRLEGVGKSHLFKFSLVHNLHTSMTFAVRTAVIPPSHFLAPKEHHFFALNLHGYFFSAIFDLCTVIGAAFSRYLALWWWREYF